MTGQEWTSFSIKSAPAQLAMTIMTIRIPSADAGSGG
jgi:hypothetical protein